VIPMEKGGRFGKEKGKEKTKNRHDYLSRNFERKKLAGRERAGGRLKREPKSCTGI